MIVRVQKKNALQNDNWVSGNVSLRCLQRIGVWGKTHKIQLLLLKSLDYGVEKGGKMITLECSTGDQISRVEA